MIVEIGQTGDGWYVKVIDGNEPTGTRCFGFRFQCFEFSIYKDDGCWHALVSYEMGGRNASILSYGDTLSLAFEDMFKKLSRSGLELEMVGDFTRGEAL